MVFGGGGASARLDAGGPVAGEHGLSKDTGSNRQEFERRMEARRAAETDAASLGALRRGWCLGSLEYKQQMLEALEGKLGDHHSGALRQEAATAKAERLWPRSWGAWVAGNGFEGAPQE